MSDQGSPGKLRTWSIVGPGIVAAATGVGAGDLVATLIAGSRYGYALLWAAVIGCIVKIALAEGTARYHLSTGSTILDGWQSLGRWTSWYFGIYIVIWGFVYGATAMSATALPLSALMPGLLPNWVWGAGVGILGAAFVALNRYDTFETVMKWLIGLMFLIVVSIAILVLPDVPSMIAGLVPRVPDGSTFYTLGLIGGVGGTITMAAYGYWVNAKGWHGPEKMGVMRLDNRVGYIVTGIFVIAMLIVGAELLYAADIALAEGNDGLIQLKDVLAERFGNFIAVLFLVGFAATSLTSLLGVWHGVSTLFADFVQNMRGQDTADRGDLHRSMPFRAYLFWLTFPPMILFAFDRPFLLVIIYGAFGAFFMPFLAITLIWLLNSSRVPAEWRSGWLSNGLLGIAAALFTLLCLNEVWGLVAGD
ncbi:Nramp family divalent metal transporter [Pelagovum pacificum]|uniref:Divalent metal cation transporter n=1 Tax=Pelagovum pacificum TaxID=2588711 RepID=A0A5C5GES8_9RHOB|nr:Nramp family divalent metal transporter [Pelagovum pacificum]QQA44161.1 Nramp family divalent metal transporter [Pelagovum pacificum]TNY32714.1 divalent metal cation transporter [Pelagovum pacificum]